MIRLKDLRDIGTEDRLLRSGFQPLRVMRERSDTWFASSAPDDDVIRATRADELLGAAYDAIVFCAGENDDRALYADSADGARIIDADIIDDRLDEALNRIADICERTASAVYSRGISKNARIQDIASALADVQRIGAIGRAMILARIGRAVRMSIREWKTQRSNGIDPEPIATAQRDARLIAPSDRFAQWSLSSFYASRIKALQRKIGNGENVAKCKKAIRKYRRAIMELNPPKTSAAPIKRLGGRLSRYVENGRYHVDMLSSTIAPKRAKRATARTKTESVYCHCYQCQAQRARIS